MPSRQSGTGWQICDCVLPAEAAGQVVEEGVVEVELGQVLQLGEALGQSETHTHSRQCSGIVTQLVNLGKIFFSLLFLFFSEINKILPQKTLQNTQFHRYFAPFWERKEEYIKTSR